ncbi:hypothetical protein GGTG_07146 [Gaeumannomyces tritici R3-111a-1]|uniref:Rhodopsin domain-containing protein n=1 Tax=Gaeumannomyces tritici (strain R3-111a-1) TaxID=644352 RepID=J3P0V0_GAET3|nr:hypothetical protein GGTG_07146 [Gaeumannomyces tritici R3-111a-1]EJT77234.1 hypothetical protein GGTG_07146 [Gaeumannomyces tritici R3-111a-1]
MVQLCDQILSPAFVYWAPIRVRITQYRYWRHVHSDQAPSTRQVWRRSRDQLILGSKYLQVTWYTYTGFLWCMKACLLFFYDRLKFNLWTYDWVFKALCWATFLSYVTVVQPLPSPECLFQGQNLIVSVVLNILTDAAILSLPLPVLQDLRTPPLKKALVALLICSGFFVISAAAVRLTATLDAAPSAVTINRWGIRECEIGLVAINTPVLRPLFTRKFWARRSSDSRIGGEGDRGAGGAAAHHHHHRGWGRGCCFFGVTLDSLAAPARTNGRGGGGGGGGTWTVGHLPQHARTDAAGAAHEQPPCGRQQRGWRRAACPGVATDQMERGRLPAEKREPQDVAARSYGTLRRTQHAS